MTIQLSTKEKYIHLLRKNGFNCFPIPKRPKDDPNQKAADRRYDSERTKENQPIQDYENYGYMGIVGQGTAIVDFDSKRYGDKLKEYAKKFMVIETKHGYHLPVIGLTGKIQKCMLFDYSIQQDKQIIEVQGVKQYVVGIGSEIFDKDGSSFTYTNIGTDEIFNAKQTNFDNFVLNICQTFNVEGKKELNKSTNRNLRERFKEGKIPVKGTSNNYFFQAALQCNTDGLTRQEAIEKIREVYKKWENSETFSSRPWGNIEDKINDVYDNDKTLKKGPQTSSQQGINRERIVNEILESRKLYSDSKTKELVEDRLGFLENINDSLHKEIQKDYPILSQPDFNDIVFKLVGLAPDIPQTNKDLIVFKNGKYSRGARALIESDDLADMGFKDYDYLENADPKRFKEILFGNVDESEHARIKAGLRAILSPYLDPKISVIHGEPRVGKSTALLILHKILGEYSIVMELDQLLGDHFIKAKVNGKRLVVLQELPQTYKDFTPLKTLTGEQYKTERGFQQDSQTFENKIKFWASGNYLAKIPQKEKSAMYSRLSLIHNTRKEQYEENPTLIEEIVKEEGEKIISWILNLTDEECKYESSFTVRSEWEKLASPEIDFLDMYYDLSEEKTSVSAATIRKLFEQKTGLHIDIKSMVAALEEQGYIVKFNVVQNIKEKKGGLF